MASSSVAKPVLATKTSSGSQNSAPSVSLVNPSPTQVPIMVEHVLNQTVGEQPLYLVRMKDNTLVYIPENMLTQSGGKVMF